MAGLVFLAIIRQLADKIQEVEDKLSELEDKLIKVEDKRPQLEDKLNEVEDKKIFTKKYNVCKSFAYHIYNKTRFNSG
ncbi:MAG: hypothetical protein K0S34_193 [Bacillales bacterium]|jgi:predicted nuclease with TOPRIM domain|nr:hypothetical protein [Bacillales bacterium]